MASYDENIAMLGIGLDSAPAAQGAQRVIDSLNEVKKAGENLKESFDKIGANLGAKFNITFPNVPDGIGEKLAGIASAMSAMAATDPDALAAGTKALSESLGMLFKVKTPSVLLPKYLSSLAQGIMDFNNATAGRDAGVALHIGNLATAIQALERVGNIDPAIPNSIKNTLQTLSEVPKSFEDVTGFKERITALRDTLSTLSMLNEMANNMPSQESIDKITSAVSNLQLHLAVSTQADGGRNVANLGRGLEALSKSLRVLTKVDVNQVVSKLGAFRAIAAELKDAMQGTPTGDGTMGYFGRSIAQMVDTLALLSEVDLSSVRGEAIKEKVELMRELLSKVSTAPASQDGNIANVGQAVMQIVAALRVLSEVDLKGIDLHLLKGRLNVIKEFMSLAQGVNGNAPVDISSSIIAIAAAFKTLSEIQLGDIDIGMLRRRLGVISDFMVSANNMLAQTPQGASNIGREISMLARGLQVLSQIQLPDTARIKAIGDTLDAIVSLNFRPFDTTGTVNLGRVAAQLSRGLQSLASIKAEDIDLEQLRATIRGIASMAADFSSANNAIGAFAVTIGKLKFQKDSAHRLTEVAQALASFQRVSPPTAEVQRFLEAVGRLADISPKVIRALAAMNSEFGRTSVPVQRASGDILAMNREISALRSGMSGLYQTFLTFAHSPVIRFFRSATRDAVEFGSELAYINSITLGEYDTGNISKGILGMSSILGDSAQIANSFYYAYSSGMRGTEEEMLGFTETMAKLSKVIRADATTTTNAITTIVNSYGLGMGDTKMLADWTTQIIKFGKATGRDLAHGLGNIVAPAQNAGLTLQELGAGIASLTKVMRTAPAITGYARMIEKLANPTAKTQKEAEKYGVSLGREAIQSQGFYNVLKQIHDLAVENPDILNKIFPDIRGKRAAIQLLTKGWDDFTRQLQNFSQGNMAGTLDQAFGKLDESTAEQVKALSETFKKLRIEIGNTIQDILTLGGTLTPLLKKFNNMGDTGRGLVGGIAGIATIAAAMQSVGFLVQTLRAMHLRNQAVLNPTMALPQILGALAMPGAAALTTANRLQLLNASPMAFPIASRLVHENNARLFTEGHLSPNLLKQRIVAEGKLVELQKSLTEGANGMRGTWNAAMNSMTLAAASSAATIKNSMIGIIPGTGLLAKGITYPGMMVNRLWLAGNGMNAAEFTAYQTGLLNSSILNLGKTARDAGANMLSMGVSVATYVAAAAGLGYTIGTLLYQIPAVQKFMDSIGEHIASWYYRLTGQYDKDPLGDLEGRNFNRGLQARQNGINRQNPYWNLGAAAMQTQKDISNLFASIGKDEEKNANVLEDMQKKMADEFKNAAEITKKLGADFRALKDATAQQRKAQEDYSAAMSVQMAQKMGYWASPIATQRKAAWTAAGIGAGGAAGSFFGGVGAAPGAAAGALAGYITGTVHGIVDTYRYNDKIDAYNQEIANTRASAEKAMQSAQKGVEDASKTVEEGLEKLFNSAKRAVQVIMDAQNLVTEYTTLRGAIVDKFAQKTFKNLTVGNQYSALQNILSRPGGLVEMYNKALLAGETKDAQKQAGKIIDVYSRQEGILKNLATAAQKANEKTLQLVFSMDKFSATASQGVDYNSMEAQRLMSRSFETLPAIKPLAEAFDGNKFYADKQTELLAPLNSLITAMNGFVASQTEALKGNAAYMKSPEAVIRAVVKSLTEETGKDSATIRSLMEKRAAKQEKKDAEDSERTTNLRVLTNALTPTIDRGKGQLKVQMQTA